MVYTEYTPLDTQMARRPLVVRLMRCSGCEPGPNLTVLLWFLSLSSVCNLQCGDEEQTISH